MILTGDLSCLYQQTDRDIEFLKGALAHEVSVDMTFRNLLRFQECLVDRDVQCGDLADACLLGLCVDHGLFLSERGGE